MLKYCQIVRAGWKSAERLEAMISQQSNRFFTSSAQCLAPLPHLQFIFNIFPSNSSLAQQCLFHFYFFTNKTAISSTVFHLTLSKTTTKQHTGEGGKHAIIRLNMLKSNYIRS